MTGEDAAELWRTFRATGDEYYLDLLVKYNEEDIINLKPLADFAVKGLWDRIRTTSPKEPLKNKIEHKP